MPVKTVTIQVNALTDRANADIRATGAYFDQLRAKNPVELKVKLDAAQALAESRILAREMSQTVRDTVRLNAEGGGLTGIARLLGGGSGGGGGLLSLILGAAPGAGGAAAAGGGTGAGIGALVGVGALASGVAGIVPALVAAGAAVAAFGALAIPTFTAVTGAISGVSAANAKFAEAAGLVDTAIATSHADLVLYNTALAKMPPNLASAAKLLGNQSVTWQGLSASQQANVIALSQNKTALASLLPAQRTALTALLASKAVWDQLSPAQQKVAIGWQHLSASYQNLAQALAPDVLAIFNSGLKIANALLPTLLPLAQQAAHAFEGIASGMAKFFQTTTSGPGPGWKPGEKLVTTLTPFGEFMKQLTSLAGPTLATLGEGLGKIAVAVGKLLLAMQSPDAIKILRVLLDGVALAINIVTAAFVYATPRIINNFHDIADAFDHARRFVAQWGHDIAHEFDSARHEAATLAHDFAHYFDDIKNAFVITWHALTGTVDQINRTFNTWQIKTGGYIDDVIGFFRTLPHRALNVLSGFGQSLYNFASNAMHLFLEGVQKVWTTVEGWFSGLPGKILHALGIHSPPDWAISAGQHVMGGLLKGMTHGAASVQSFFVGLASNLLGPLKSIWADIFGSGQVPNVGSGVARWGGLVRQALLMEGLPQSYLPLVLYQMQTESGGNPNAINLTDINAQQGDPSRGLMQVIGTTFAAYHWPGTSGNIYDPLANIAAALNYARHNKGFGTGPGQIGSGHGYAFGGLLTEPVFGVGASGASYMFGERGPEWIGGGGGGGWWAQQMIALLEQVVDLLADGNDITARAPIATGAALGAGLAGGARAATYKALYS